MNDMIAGHVTGTVYLGINANPGPLAITSTGVVRPATGNGIDQDQSSHLRNTGVATAAAGEAGIYLQTTTAITNTASRINSGAVTGGIGGAGGIADAGGTGISAAAEGVRLNTVSSCNARKTLPARSPAGGSTAPCCRRQPPARVPPDAKPRQISSHAATLGP